MLYEEDVEDDNTEPVARSLESDEQIVIEKFSQDAEEFIRYAARFLLLTNEASTSSPTFKETAGFLLNWSPPKEIIEALFKEDELTEASLRDLSDEELDVLSSLLGRTPFEREQKIRAIKRVLRSENPSIGQVTKVMTSKKAQTRRKKTYSVSDANQYFDKVFSNIEKYAEDTSGYFKMLQKQYVPFVKKQFRLYGEKFFRENDNLSDEFPLKKADKKGSSLMSFFKSPEKVKLTDEDFQEFMSDDKFYKDPATVDAVVQKLKEAMAAKYRALTATMTEGISLVLDLNEAKKLDNLNESFMVMFRTWVKLILQTIFGDLSLPLNVKGNPRDVESFAKAISGEKRYIDSIKKHGLNNRQTYASRANLASSISKFERDTGLTWPFK